MSSNDNTSATQVVAQTPSAPVNRHSLLTRIQELENETATLRRQLVTQSTGEHDAAGNFDVLTFNVHDVTFAVYLSDVVEVLRMVKWQPLPKSPPDVQGVINCRGAILPVLNPGSILSNKPVECGLGASIVVVGMSSQSVGIVVESVGGVQNHAKTSLSLSETQAKTLPLHMIGFIKIETGHIALLDVNQLLSFEQSKSLNLALRERDEWGQE